MYTERILGIPVWMYKEKLEKSRGVVRYTSVSFLMESLDEFDRRNIQLDSNEGMLLIESEDGKSFDEEIYLLDFPGFRKLMSRRMELF